MSTLQRSRPRTDGEDEDAEPERTSERTEADAGTASTGPEAEAEPATGTEADVDGDGDTDDEPAAEAPPTSMEKDTAFHLLSNSRRRAVLRQVRDADGTIELGPVAERIAARENDTVPEAIDADERKRVYISLYQCHLGKLADASIIEYDQARGTIDEGPLLPAVAPFIDESPLTVEESVDGSGGADDASGSGSGIVASVGALFGR